MARLGMYTSEFESYESLKIQIQSCDFFQISRAKITFLFSTWKSLVAIA